MPQMSIIYLILYHFIAFDFIPLLHYCIPRYITLNRSFGHLAIQNYLYILQYTHVCALGFVCEIQIIRAAKRAIKWIFSIFRSMLLGGLAAY